ncbi:uncharacterized protein CYBJADRAFT_75502 [Cyberlindnera jadinii NRRL Y-1542]|uniref:Uncharacterized protein n=1 Tax=Cyberlindnera jadinii (strain ATCC 18201 / CBS 1600 / BCRC 20928 / JCM 3617 / NBRC 0987 / NRRL Y-1542) TaxID=983966 RepID=A0A1E4S509_CYBJN|nr:hypothetical protein CYBJADRAFT_75502 [Cyberlindnera jadinii NRRL Y-1542]ODV74533.1 hypothetical protein CYBJADRAFT_75502 [Cyberlindnera jadinii NRRL Y-1542]
MALSLLEEKLNSSLLENTTASISYAKRTNEEMLKQELLETKAMVKDKDNKLKSILKDRDNKIKELEEKITHMQNVMQNH